MKKRQGFLEVGKNKPLIKRCLKEFWKNVDKTFVIREFITKVNEKSRVSDNMRFLINRFSKRGFIHLTRDKIYPNSIFILTEKMKRIFESMNNEPEKGEYYFELLLELLEGKPKKKGYLLMKFRKGEISKETEEFFSKRITSLMIEIILFFIEYNKNLLSVKELSNKIDSNVTRTKKEIEKLVRYKILLEGDGMYKINPNNEINILLFEMEKTTNPFIILEFFSNKKCNIDEAILGIEQSPQYKKYSKTLKI